MRGVPDKLPLPAPVTLGWDAGDVFSPRAVAQDHLKLLVRDSVCPGRPSAQWGIVFGISGAVCGVRDVATTLECLPGLQLQAHAKRCPRWWESLDTLKERLDLRQDLAEAWEVGNLQRYLSHLPEVAPFARPSRGAFRHLYGPARTPPVQPRFCAQVDVAPRARAKVALEQLRHRHQKTLRELTPGDVRALTVWVTPTRPLGLPTATVPHLRRILQRTGNTALARDQL